MLSLALLVYAVLLLKWVCNGRDVFRSEFSGVRVRLCTLGLHQVCVHFRYYSVLRFVVDGPTELR